MTFHFNTARGAGVTEHEIKTAIAIGEMIREKPKEHMQKLLDKLETEFTTTK